MIFCLHELYLAPFARYSAYKISVSDLELSGSPKVKSCNFKKAHMRLYNGILLTRILYLVTITRYSASKISVSDLIF